MNATRSSDLQFAAFSIRAYLKLYYPSSQHQTMASGDMTFHPLPEKVVSGSQELGEVTANEYGFLRGDENVLELIVLMVTQPC